MVKLKQTILLALAFLSSCYSITQAEKPPNVILIMVDDLGAVSLPAYGNTTHFTPHLDSLAEQGAVFENAYATPICTPTRAMILTGLLPSRSGFLERLDSPYDKEKQNRLPKHIKTFAHTFRDAGYKTAIAGKWHLGDFKKYPNHPKSHGFEEYCLWVQIWNGARRSRYYVPHYWENGKYKIYDKDVYGPDYTTKFLTNFIEKNKEKPFLAYYPMNLIHGPLVIPPGDMSSAKKKMINAMSEKEKRLALMIYYMDLCVGKLLKKLEETDLSKNTIVIFTGDNGTSRSFMSYTKEGKVPGGKGQMNEAGTRVPFIVRWPGKIPPGRRENIFSLMDVYPTLVKIAGVGIDHKIDGMDLSHNFFNKKGKNREVFQMSFEGGKHFVRNSQFRLHENGELYHVPMSSDIGRYSSQKADSEKYKNEYGNLKEHLEQLMRIRKEDDSYKLIPFNKKYLK